MLGWPRVVESQLLRLVLHLVNFIFFFFWWEVCDWKMEIDRNCAKVLFKKCILSFVFVNVGEYSFILCGVLWFYISLVSVCVYVWWPTTCSRHGGQYWLSQAEQKARGKSGSRLRAWYGGSGSGCGSKNWTQLHKIHHLYEKSLAPCTHTYLYVRTCVYYILLRIFAKCICEFLCYIFFLLLMQF